MTSEDEIYRTLRTPAKIQYFSWLSPRHRYFMDNRPYKAGRLGMHV